MFSRRIQDRKHTHYLTKSLIRREIEVEGDLETTLILTPSKIYCRNVGIKINRLFKLRPLWSTFENVLSYL